MAVNVDGEKRYENVFGDTFALYNKKEMQEFIEPFQVRFERNNLDAARIFKGKRCLDAGCGNARGAIFMLMNGAEHVTCYDFSEKNIESARRNLADFGYSSAEFRQGTLEDIPYEDETFDFVWCNGVVMHTAHPNKCLAELSRVLKTGCQSWIYIYGSGGIYWRIIYHLRNLVKDVNIGKCMAALHLFRYETRYIAEFIDDWFSTHLRTYTHSDLARRLEATGFQSPELLAYGMDYDSSHRLTNAATEEEKDMMGEGDLRYLLTKTKHVSTDDSLLNEGEYGSDYSYPSTITDTIDPLFASIEEERLPAWKRVALAAHIQRELRILLDCDNAFDLNKMTEIIQELVQKTKEAGEL